MDIFKIVFTSLACVTILLCFGFYMKKQVKRKFDTNKDVDNIFDEDGKTNDKIDVDNLILDDVKEEADNVKISKDEDYNDFQINSFIAEELTYLHAELHEMKNIQLETDKLIKKLRMDLMLLPKTLKTDNELILNILNEIRLKSEDVLLIPAIDYVRRTNEKSVFDIQKWLNIDYERAAFLLSRMEEMKIIE